MHGAYCLVSCGLGAFFFLPSSFPLYYLPFPITSLSLSLCCDESCPDEFNSITPWLHRSHYSQASREHSNKQMKMTLIQPVHTHTNTHNLEKKLHQGRAQNKNLSLDYFRQNKSQPFRHTHSNL